jgi:hypothetical protein
LAGFGGCLKGSLRKPALAILGRKKAGEAFSHDFVCFVPFQTACARVPAYDSAFGIEHVERVVYDRVEEQLKPTLMLELLNGPAGRHGCLHLEKKFQLRIKRPALGSWP